MKKMVERYLSLIIDYVNSEIAFERVLISVGTISQTF